MKATKFFFTSVLLLGLVTVTIQNIGRKGCDCSICKGVDNKINPILGKKIDAGDGGKSSCNICEHKKRLLQEERERQEKLQKCPFEILGSANIKGKTSEEVFDEFRELVVPSQNGFFDMMRGVVKTMHVSSEQELKWAKEKEARELARKKEEEERKQREPKPAQNELVGLDSPVNPKVTVILNQTPCGQIIPQVGRTESESESLMRRLPKEANDEISMANEDEILQHLELIPDLNDNTRGSLLNADLNENLLHSNLLQQLVGYDQWITETPQEVKTETTTLPAEFYEYRVEENDIETVTESPFVKFLSNEEWKAQASGVVSKDGNILGLLSPISEITTEKMENFTPGIKYTSESVVKK